METRKMKVIKWGVGILALVVLGWSGLTIVTTTMFPAYYWNSCSIDGPLNKNAYLGTLIPNANFIITDVDVSIRLLRVNGTYIPGNVSACIIHFGTVDTILDHFNDTTSYSPLFFMCKLLNSSQDVMSFNYNQTVPTGAKMYFFGGNASTGTGWWNDNQTAINIHVLYQGQYVSQEPATTYFPLLIGALLSTALAVVVIFFLRKKQES